MIAAQPKATSTSPEHFSTSLKPSRPATNKEPELLWNFEKFVVDRKGNVTARFAPNATPDDPALVKTLETELAKPN